MTAKEKSVQNSVCLHHPDRPATTRCDVCFKPICAECAMHTGEGTFCSQDCIDKFSGIEENVGQWYAQESRRKSRRFRRRVMGLVILLVAAWALYRYFNRNPDKLNELKTKAGSAVQGVEKRVAP